MKLKEISIENFRGYKSRVTVTFEDLTAFVRKNDIGKSTILEALDIFFNDFRKAYTRKLSILSASSEIF